MPKIRPPRSNGKNGHAGNGEKPADAKGNGHPPQDPQKPTENLPAPIEGRRIGPAEKRRAEQRERVRASLKRRAASRVTEKTAATSAKNIKRLERVFEAFEYRLLGHSYRVIGQAMGIEPSTVYNYVVEAINMRIIEPHEERVIQDLERLDIALAPIMQAAAEGDYQATDRLLKIIEARNTLLGIGKEKPAEGGGLSIKFPEGGGDVRLIAEFVAPPRPPED